MRVCDTCKLTPDADACANCGPDRKKTFVGDNALEDFCGWLFRKAHKKYTAIAHNSRGFDAQFILDFLHQKKCKAPKIIPKGKMFIQLHYSIISTHFKLSGLEIMCLEAAGLRLIDSLNFLPMPLASMPKTFGEKELSKGYFPHFFNTAANTNYNGPLPDPEMYGADAMKEGNILLFIYLFELFTSY